MCFLCPSLEYVKGQVGLLDFVLGSGSLVLGPQTSDPSAFHQEFISAGYKLRHSAKRHQKVVIGISRTYEGRNLDDLYLDLTVRSPNARLSP